MSVDVRTEVAANLLKVGGVKFGEFRLKLHEKNDRAPLSPIYFDLRVIRSFPSLMYSVTNLYLEMMGSLRFDLLADVPTAATPIVAVLSHRTGVPMVSPRVRLRTTEARFMSKAPTNTVSAPCSSTIS